MEKVENKALDILENNSFYRHLILFKLYIEHKGAVNELYYDLTKEVKNLLKDRFNLNDYNIAVNYLEQKNYTQYRGKGMTTIGVDYFENFIIKYSKLEIEDQDILEKELPKEYFDFFKFTKNINTVLSFVNGIVKLANHSN